MSKPFDSGPSDGPADDWSDDELRRACAELDGHIPDGYFAEFSSRLAAKLEMEPMETSETNDLSGPAAPPAQGAEGERDANDEHSGLHEIKALASTARAKIRRRTTEHDIEESLLASSSTGMPAVILPDPDKSTPGMAVLSSSSPSLSMPALGASHQATFGAGIAERRRGRPLLWLAIGGTALAAAAAVFFIVQNGASDEGETLARGDSSEAASETAVTPTEPLAPPPAAARAAGAPSVIALEETKADAFAASAPEGAESSPSDDDATQAAPQAGVSGSRGEAKSALEKKKVVATDSSRDGKQEESDNGAKGKEARLIGGAGAVEKEADKKPEGKTEAGDLNAILDEVTGGPDKKTEPDPEEVAKPDKKRLGSSDVKKAMGGVSGKVKKCGSKTGFTGRVAMKFSVAPSGKVTKAKASTSDSTVARCVEAAVKSASFPTFLPPSMSFSYPFLITD